MADLFPFGDDLTLDVLVPSFTTRSSSDRPSDVHRPSNATWRDRSAVPVREAMRIDTASGTREARNVARLTLPPPWRFSQ